MGSHIRCLKFHWSDDTSSDKYGGFTLDKNKDFSDHDIGKIDVYKMRDQNTLARLTFFDRKGDVIVNMQGSIGAVAEP